MFYPVLSKQHPLAALQGDDLFRLAYVLLRHSPLRHMDPRAVDRLGGLLAGEEGVSVRGEGASWIVGSAAVASASDAGCITAPLDGRFVNCGVAADSEGHPCWAMASRPKAGALGRIKWSRTLGRVASAGGHRSSDFPMIPASSHISEPPSARLHERTPENASLV